MLDFIFILKHHSTNQNRIRLSISFSKIPSYMRMNTFYSKVQYTLIQVMWCSTAQRVNTHLIDNIHSNCHLYVVRFYNKHATDVTSQKENCILVLDQREVPSTRATVKINTTHYCRKS